MPYVKHRRALWIHLREFSIPGWVCDFCTFVSDQGTNPLPPRRHPIPLVRRGLRVMRRRSIGFAVTGLLAVMLTGCQGLRPAPVTTGTTTYQLTVTAPASNQGTITSTPAGINCPTTCSASFAQGTQVTLTATAGTGYFFAGWSGGGCSGTSTCSVTITAATSISDSFTTGLGLTVTEAGGGTGTVTSTPAGINCSTATTATCTANFASGTVVTLSETPATGSTFASWSGACTGTAACSVTLTAASAVTATFGGSLQSINHIIFFAQENRSFDHYFGYMRQYWANQGIPDQAFDGLPQFNPPVNSSLIPTVPGCDPSQPPPAACQASPSATPVPSFHMQSICTEEISPFWNEAHVDWNYSAPSGSTGLLNGWAQAAANDARQYYLQPVHDVNGYRSMGYFTDADLNYYYFMASNFATSDRWFAPVMSRSQLNRMFVLAGTSAGHVYPLAPPEGPLSNKTILEALQDAGITWKVYVNPNSTDPTTGTNCSTATGAAQNKCLANVSYINMFTYEATIQATPALYQNFVPTTQFQSDLQNDSTFAQVVFIEPASDAGLDEHPTDSITGGVNIQVGAAYAASLINDLMTSPSWKDSAMIFTYDEPGGFYDHVQPQPVPVPDSFPYPIDLQNSYDACYGMTATSGVCSFGMTGYRIPLIVISPFAKKNFVSHTLRDSTAWLNLVEERFKISPLTARDAYWSTTSPVATMDEFFDFTLVPWATPPSPPAQATNGTCSLAAPTP